MAKPESTLADYGSGSEDSIEDKTFVIFGSNGNWMIEKILKDLGWKALSDKFAHSFMFKWVESRLSVNYDLFKEGQQLVNRIPNCYMLTNKLGLLVNLHRFQSSMHKREQAVVPKLKLSDFLPETYRLDDQRDRSFFSQRFKPGEVWISKPIGLNQGRGIYLVRDVDNYNVSLKEDEKEHGGSRLIQRYITNPLLMDGKKFDIRVYMLVASTKPYLILFRKGYLRLSLHKYNCQSEDISVHLTNQFIQRKCASYDACKNETICSYEKFNSYVNNFIAPGKKLETDWVHKTLWNRMKEIALYSFFSVKDKLKTSVGYFDLYGLDFLVGEDMKVWLLEVNVNPCLATNCEHLRVIVPEIIQETIHIALECFTKCQHKKPLLPLASQKTFETLFYEGMPIIDVPMPTIKLPPPPETLIPRVKETSPTTPPKSNIISVVFHSEKYSQNETKSMFELLHNKANKIHYERKIPTGATDDTIQAHSHNKELQLEKINSEAINKPTNETAGDRKVESVSDPIESDKDILRCQKSDIVFDDNCGSPVATSNKAKTKDQTTLVVTVADATVKGSHSKDHIVTSSAADTTKVSSGTSDEGKITKVENKRQETETSSIKFTREAKNTEKTSKMNRVSLSFQNSQRTSSIMKQTISNIRGGSKTATNSRSSETKEVRFSDGGPSRVKRLSLGSATGLSILKKTDSNKRSASDRFPQKNRSSEVMTSTSKQGSINFVAANKLLLQTLTKMNVEKRVRQLQNKFYNSVSPI